MITARPQKKLHGAKVYFREHLSQGDYHSENQKIAGQWFGRGAERLGLDLTAPVSETAFVRLCDNLHPVTGQKLTVLQRQVDRRVFYDFVVSAPKSVSFMAVTMGDERILAAHDAAVRTTLAQMEKLAATRVRRGGKSTERVTGELLTAIFRHDSSRALDPQLHSHLVAFNATWDDTEQRWKALQSRFLFDHIHFFTEVYRSELSASLRSLGYQLRGTDNGFEIVGVAPELIERFSKRKRAIAKAEAKLAAQLGKPLSNDGRARIAHTDRERKRHDVPSEEVVATQRAQLSTGELASLARVEDRTAGTAPTPAGASTPPAGVCGEDPDGQGFRLSGFVVLDHAAAGRRAGGRSTQVVVWLGRPSQPFRK